MQIELKLKVTDDKKTFNAEYTSEASNVRDRIEYLEQVFRTVYFSWLSQLPEEIKTELEKPEPEPKPKVKAKEIKNDKV